MHPSQNPVWQCALNEANAAPRCGARTRSGQPCQSPAMKNGRCRMHGGTSLSGRNHGRYRHGLHTQSAKANRAHIRDLIHSARDTMAGMTV
ncbi:MAG: HGGxSTG domain-containing protein [Alphaproteobacteria bacterium]